MAISLETLILEFKGDFTRFDAELNKATTRAERFTRLTETTLSRLNNLAIEPKVNHAPLEELNKHLDLKTQHLDEVQQYFNTNPLKPLVDTAALAQQLQNLGEDLALKVAIDASNRFEASSSLSANRIVSAIQTSTTALSKELEELKVSVFGRVFTGAAELFGERAAEHYLTGGDLGGDVRNLIKTSEKALNKVKQATTQGKTDLVDNLKGAYQTASNLKKDDLKKIYKETTQNLKDKIENNKPTSLSGLFNTSKIDKLTQNVYTKLDKLIRLLPENSNKEKIIKVVALKSFTKLRETGSLEKVKQAVINRTQPTWDKLLPQLAQLKSRYNITTTFVPQLGKTKETLQKYLNDLKIKLPSFGEAKTKAMGVISNRQKAFVSRVEPGLEKAIQRAKQIAKEAESIGVNVIAGIEQGITKRSDTVFKSMSAIASGILTKVKDIWDIHSPSQAFARLGKYAIEGLQKGLNPGVITQSFPKELKTLADYYKKELVGVFRAVRLAKSDLTYGFGEQLEEETPKGRVALLGSKVKRKLMSLAQGTKQKLKPPVVDPIEDFWLDYEQKHRPKPPEPPKAPEAPKPSKPPATLLQRLSKVKVGDVAALAAGWVGLTTLAPIVKNVVAGGLQSADALSKVNQQLENINPGGLNRVNAAVEQLGLGLGETKAAYVGFLSALQGTSLEGNLGVDMFTDFLGVTRTMGLSDDKRNNASVALQQIASKGRLYAEELRGQLSEAMSNAITVATSSLGLLESRDLFKEMENGISAYEFLPKFTSALGVSAAVNKVSTLESAIGRLGTESEKLTTTISTPFLAVGKAITDATTSGLSFINFLVEIGLKYGGAAIGVLAVVAAFKALENLMASTSKGDPTTTLKQGFGNVLNIINENKVAIARATAELGLFTAATFVLNEAWQAFSTIQETVIDGNLEKLESINAKLREQGGLLDANSNKGLQTKQLDIGRGATNKSFLDKSIGFLNDRLKGNPITDYLYKGNRNELELLYGKAAPSSNRMLTVAEADTIRETQKVFEEIGRFNEGANQIYAKLREAVVESNSIQTRIESKRTQIANEPDRNKRYQLYNDPNGVKVLEAQQAIFSRKIGQGLSSLSEYKKLLESTRTALKDNAIANETLDTRLVQDTLKRLDLELKVVESQFKAASRAVNELGDAIKKSARELKQGNFSTNRLLVEQDLDTGKTQAEQLRANKLKQGTFAVDNADLNYKDAAKRLYLLTERRDKLLASLEQPDMQQALLDLNVNLKSGTEVVADKLTQEDLSDKHKLALETLQSFYDYQQKASDANLASAQAWADAAQAVKDRAESLRSFTQNVVSFQRSLSDAALNASRSQEDFRLNVESTRKSIYRQSRDLSESYQALVKDLVTDLERGKNEIEKTKNDINRTQLSTSLKKAIGAGTNGVAAELLKLFDQIQDTLLQKETAQQDINLARLDISQKTLEVARQIRGLEEQQADLEESRLNEIRTLNRVAADFALEQKRQWEDFLLQQEQINREAADLGVDLNKLSNSVTTQGNNLVTALTTITTNLFKVNDVVQGKQPTLPVESNKSTTNNTSKAALPAIAKNLAAPDKVKLTPAINNTSKQTIKNSSSSPVMFPIMGRRANQSLPYSPEGYPEATRIRNGKRGLHGGIDYLYAKGTPVYAATDGVIHEKLTNKGEWGIKLRTINEKGQQVITHYFHLMDTLVKAGQKLRKGDLIGHVGGDKGSWGSTGVHFDHKVQIAGKFIDPRLFYKNPEKYGFTSPADAVEEPTKATRSKASIASITPKQKTKAPDKTKLKLSNSDLNLLQRLLLAEAGGEGVEGMALVARSVFNRQALIKSGAVTPSTYNAKSGNLKDIIYGKNQFEPVSNGSINKKRTANELDAAAEAIRLALDTERLIKTIRNFRSSSADVQKLVSATGFRADTASFDPSQNHNVAIFRNHKFNSDRFAKKQNVVELYEKIIGSTPYTTEDNLQAAEGSNKPSLSGDRQPQTQPKGIPTLTPPKAIIDFDNPPTPTLTPPDYTSPQQVFESKQIPKIETSTPQDLSTQVTKQSEELNNQRSKQAQTQFEESMRAIGESAQAHSQAMIDGIEESKQGLANIAATNANLISNLDGVITAQEEAAKAKQERERELSTQIQANNAAIKERAAIIAESQGKLGLLEEQLNKLDLPKDTKQSMLNAVALTEQRIELANQEIASLEKLNAELELAAPTLLAVAEKLSNLNVEAKQIEEEQYVQQDASALARLEVDSTNDPIKRDRLNRAAKISEENLDYRSRAIAIKRTGLERGYSQPQIDKALANAQALHEANIEKIIQDTNTLGNAFALLTPALSGVVKGFGEVLIGTKDLGDMLGDVALSILSTISDLATDYIEGWVKDQLVGFGSQFDLNPMTSLSGGGDLVSTGLSTINSVFATGAGGDRGAGGVSALSEAAIGAATTINSLGTSALEAGFSVATGITDSLSQQTLTVGLAQLSTMSTALGATLLQLNVTATTLIPTLIAFQAALTSQTAQTALSSTAKAFSGGVFGGGFSAGGEIPNFAKGGLNDSVGAALQRERSGAPGKKPVLAVLHEGEQVLSTLNGDAQFWRNLKQNGDWAELKNQGVQNFVIGGTVGQNTSNSYWSGSSANAKRTEVNRSTTFINNYSITTPDADTFRRSRSQIDAEAEIRSRRAFDRNK